MTSRLFTDVPEGWAERTHVAGIDWFLVILILPIAAALVITLIVALPGLIKGHGLTGGQPQPAEGMSSERPGSH